MVTTTVSPCTTLARFTTNLGAFGCASLATVIRLIVAHAASQFPPQMGTSSECEEMLLTLSNWYGEAAFTAIALPAVKVRSFSTHAYVAVTLPFIRFTVGRRSVPSFFQVGTPNGTPDAGPEPIPYDASCLIPAYAGIYDAVWEGAVA